MGMAYWLEIRKGESVECDEEDIYMLCRHNDKLDEICRKLGVTELSEFVDSTEIVREFDDELEISVADAALYDEGKRPYDLDEMVWADPSEGVVSIAAIGVYLSDHPRWSNLGEDDRNLLFEEINSVLEQLKSAAKDSRPFHLAILP